MILFFAFIYYLFFVRLTKVQQKVFQESVPDSIFCFFLEKKKLYLFIIYFLLDLQKIVSLYFNLTQ